MCAVLSEVCTDIAAHALTHTTSLSLPPPLSPHSLFSHVQDEGLVVGRVCVDAAQGKLNSRSVVLEVWRG